MLAARRAMLRRLLVGGGLLVLGLPAAAGAAWRQPWAGVSDTSGGIGLAAGSGLTLRGVDGVPYVAWSQFDGTNGEVRVARVNPSTTAWEQPWSGVTDTYGGINGSAQRNAVEPSLAAVDGVPYVAWQDWDDRDGDVRVARHNPATNAWEEPWSGVSDTYGGINQSRERHAFPPMLEEIDGVPYVAWTEQDDGSLSEARVARLNPSTNTWEQPWRGVSDSYGGISHSSERDSGVAAFAAVDGVPYVAWTQSTDLGGNHIRVARLNPSTNAWEQPWEGVSDSYGGIGGARDLVAYLSLADVGGVPHIAFLQVAEDRGSAAIRVARLNPSTNAWEQPWGNPSDAPDWGGLYNTVPSLTAIGNVPYVAWAQQAGSGHLNARTRPPPWHPSIELRVARLNRSAGAWEQPWRGVSDSYGGINQSTFGAATSPTLDEIGGVPYVSWNEYFDLYQAPARVARLEPEFLSQRAEPSATGANLAVGVRTFGLPYAVGFQYGSRLEHETSTDTAPTSGDEVSVARQLQGLSPGTTYRYRPFATAGPPALKLVGETTLFTTTPAPEPPGPVGPSDTKAPRTVLAKRPHVRTRKRRATFRFSSNEPRSSFQCKLDARPFKACRSPKTVKVKPGRHTFQVRARDAAGNVDRSPARFHWVVLRPKSAKPQVSAHR